MKVEQNITVFAGAAPDYAHMVKAGTDEEKDSKERKTIFAGDFQGAQTLQERIQQRKEDARQQALKVVRDAWAGDQAIDQSLDESRQRVRDLNAENRQIRDDLNEVERKRQELMETYGVTEDTPLEKQPQEYRDRMKELDDYASYNRKLLAKNVGEIIGENAAIRGTKLERLKKHPMVDAQEDADEILEAAGDEIIGMAVKAAKEHQDEKQAEREEQAEKIEEKKEEMEELQEKREERRGELEELIENIPVKEVLDLDQEKENIQEEVQSIIDKMKLMAEDIKGALIDTNI